MNTARIKRRSVTLAELQGGGWMWREYGRTYCSLATAVRAVNRDARSIARGGVTLVSIITYEPRTAAGTAVARAITGAKCEA